MVAFKNTKNEQLIENYSEGGDILSHVISDECINCGACDDSCPTNAISDAGEKRAIDPDICIDCGACVDTCPVIAISAA